MTTQVIANEYARKHFPHLIGLTFTPKYWDKDNEDLIWIECVENPKLSGFMFYLSLENWRIE